MLWSLTLAIALALLLGNLFRRISLPPLLGMMLAGYLLGPWGPIEALSKTIHPTVLDSSAELRLGALLIILLRAGLGLNRGVLKKIGAPAIKMGFVPCLVEGLTITFAARYFLDFAWMEGVLLGFVISAVSPAVVVPQMLELREKGLGQKREVPAMILAGASLDDVVSITIFASILATLSGGGSLDWMSMAQVPVAVVSGLVAGAILGGILAFVLERLASRAAVRVMGLLGLAVLLNHLEHILPIPFSGLFAVMALGFVIRERAPVYAESFSKGLNHLWVAAELLLFLLIGAAVDPAIALDVGWTGLGILFLGLMLRSVGVWIALWKSVYTRGERVFAILAYLPKATVQAAIGGTALTMVQSGKLELSGGLAQAEQILVFAVGAILITAPLGAVAIKLTSKSLLAENSKN